MPVTNLDIMRNYPILTDKLVWRIDENKFNFSSYDLSDSAPGTSYTKTAIIGDTELYINYMTHPYDSSYMVNKTIISRSETDYSRYIILADGKVYQHSPGDAHLQIPIVSHVTVIGVPYGITFVVTDLAITLGKGICFNGAGQIINGTPNGENINYPAGNKAIILGAKIKEYSAVKPTINNEDIMIGIMGEDSSGNVCICDFELSPLTTLTSSRLLEGTYTDLVTSNVATPVKTYSILLGEQAPPADMGISYIDDISSIADRKTDVNFELYKPAISNKIMLTPWNSNINDHIVLNDFLKRNKYGLAAIDFGQILTPFTPSINKLPIVRFKPSTPEVLPVESDMYPEVIVNNRPKYNHVPKIDLDDYSFINIPERLFNDESDYYLNLSGEYVEDTDSSLIDDEDHIKLSRWEGSFLWNRPYFMDINKNDIFDIGIYSNIKDDILVFKNNLLVPDNDTFGISVLINTHDLVTRITYCDLRMGKGDDLFILYDPSIKVNRIDIGTLDTDLLNVGIINTRYNPFTDVVYVNGVLLKDVNNQENTLINTSESIRYGVDHIVLGTAMRNVNIEDVVVLTPRSSYVETMYETYKAEHTRRRTLSPNDYIVSQSSVTTINMSNPYKLSEYTKPSERALYAVLMKLLTKLVLNEEGLDEAQVDAYIAAIQEEFTVLTVKNIHGTNTERQDRIVISGDGVDPGDYMYIIDPNEG